MNGAAIAATMKMKAHGRDWSGDQAKFMTACGQTIGVPNWGQTALYFDLVKEEVEEMARSWALRDSDIGHVELAAKLADDAIDTIVVSLGVLHSLGIDPNRAWSEVYQSNAAKVDPETGAVRKREDGKVLKGPNWVPPDMKKVVMESWGLK
jgi:predicted HAD superfamily Cof-like phosphohydrolase